MSPVVNLIQIGEKLRKYGEIFFDAHTYSMPFKVLPYRISLKCLTQ
jgi:hypothetical protein